MKSHSLFAIMLAGALLSGCGGGYILTKINAVSDTDFYEEKKSRYF